MEKTKQHSIRLFLSQSLTLAQGFIFLCYFLMIIPAHGGLSSADSCSPLDYTRIATQCNNGVRNVSYAKRRECTDVLPVTNHTEACSCTLEDYKAVYEWGADKTCTLRYQPEGCTGGTVSQPLPVADYFCASNRNPCTATDVRYTYTTCDQTLNVTIAKPTRKVIYYFEDDCNPDHVNSIKLPRTIDISCDLQCGAGYFLKGDACEPCAAGEFSVGGGLRWDSFETLDAKYIRTKCTFTNATTDTEESCKSWSVSKGTLVVGPYDNTNEYDADECHDDPGLQCHNNLRAYLTFTVTLIRDGSVTFNFSVDAERSDREGDHGDGLRFYIDENPEPLLIAAYEFGSRQVAFNLSAGYHTLTWLYKKDDEWTKGSDGALITFLEVNGTDLYDSACTPCSAGYFSSASADMCTPCPVGYYTNSDGASECAACPEGQYSLEHPRASCKTRPVCDLAKHASVSYSQCTTVNGKSLRKKRYDWIQPKVCMETGGQSLPKEAEEACPPCDRGQRVMKDPNTDERRCVYCPEGSALSDDGTMCELCSNGTAALKWLNFTRFDEQNGQLPSVLTTGCEGDCGSPGWRVVNTRIDSGLGHGKKVKVWLLLNFTLEVQSSVHFEYSIISSGDFTRYFDYYVDDDLAGRLMVDTDDDFMAGPGTVDLTETTEALQAGTHSLLFVYTKMDDTQVPRDTVEISFISIRGEKSGGAAECVAIPVGNQASKGGSAWEPCPPGTFGPGGTSPCVKCPADTYNPTPGMGGPCARCAMGTSSADGASECFVGDISSQASFCTYEPDVSKAKRQSASGNQTQWLPSIFYDLSPLAMKHPDTPYALVPEVKPEGASFSISVCNRVNHTFCSFDRKPRFTYACRVDEQRSSTSKPMERSDSHYSSELAESVQLLPLGTGLETRGLIMQFQAAGCLSGRSGNGFQNRVRKTDLYFICDPSAGYGQPEAWGEEGKRRALSPTAPFPDRLSSDTKVPIQMDKDGCSFSLVWYSLYACPLCTPADVESQLLSDCPGGIRRVYRYKEPQTCAPNPFEPLPPSVPCSACTSADWTEVLEHCLDSQGKRNISYTWKHPQNCSDIVQGSLPLPPPVLAGPCAQNVTVADNGGIISWSSMQVLGLIASLVFGIIVLAVVAVVACVQNRHLYSAYAKLAQTAVGDFELTAGHTD